MKRTISLLLILLHSVLLNAQNVDSNPEDKSIVYFTRAKSSGFLINFTYFDGEKVIGKFNGLKYMKYECDPGKHLFWARSENKSFVEADLKPGGIYIIDVIPRIGGIKPSVKLMPVDKNDYKLKKIQKLVSGQEPQMFDESQLTELQNEMSEVITRGMEKHKQLREKGKKILQLKPEMTVTEDDLIYEKKKSGNR